MIPVLLVTGPIGAGKTTVAAEISEQLDAAAIAHAFVDVDALRWCYPRSADDPFRVKLAMKNLSAIWRNFQDIGAERFVLADVLESRDDLEMYRAAVPGAEFFVARLHASMHTLATRVALREHGSGLERMLARSAELNAIFERNHVEDLLIDTDEKSVTEIAREILHGSGWLPSPVHEPGDGSVS